MKRIAAITMTLLLLLGSFGMAAFAAEEPEQASVYVTIADKDGKLVLAQEKITVSDVDEDDALTINDALYAAHEAKYEGGAAAGYASSYGDYGLSLNKLWGTANGGNYGYYVNNSAAWNLTDPVKEGDYVNAFVYTDLATWSDTYCYFDVNTVGGKAGDAITLTLSAAGFDENYQPVTKPVKDAVITLNGDKTTYKTDANGKVTLTMAEGGSYIISAVSDTEILVPPVCKAIITPTSAHVYVTISDKDGKLVLAQEKITVSDVDEDGALTINDALYAAHEAKYEGGAAAGYASSYGDYGLGLKKLWGTANGGSYGYYVNNSAAWSLTDPVKEGDYVNAFVYTDLTTWSDAYCYFDSYTVSGKAGDTITLTLSAAGFDENYQPVTKPVKGAVITLNGDKTTYTTDENGKVTITIEQEGTYVVSAVSDTDILVPPVCIATVSAATAATDPGQAGETDSTGSTDTTDTDKTAADPTDAATGTPGNTGSPEASPNTGDTAPLAVVMISLVSLAAMLALSAKRQQAYEK